jgi:hypothetical protein
MQTNIINLIHLDVDLSGLKKTKIKNSKKTKKKTKRNKKVTNSKVKTYTDNNQKLSKKQLQERYEANQDQYNNLLNSRKLNVDLRVQAEVVKALLDSIDDNQHHMLITWTYPKKYGWKDDEVLKDVFAIRSRIIKLLFPNFKPKLNNRPDGCPRMYFFRERHSDKQFHIHLLMETIEPHLWAICLDRDSFKLRWYTIMNKISKRKPEQKRVITRKMIDRWGDYKNHPYASTTFDQIKSNYDEWKVARFICDYISHYRDDERWGLNRISNSPDNNHSKVIESKAEIHFKCSYLNKDRYFIHRDNDFLRHIVPEYSDF